MAKKQNTKQTNGGVAILRYARLSPTKARLIAGQVQGMNAEVALASLEFTKAIYKTLASALANGGFESTGAEVTSCRVDAGPVLRRFMPRARGRATPIRKPMAHIYVEVNAVKKAAKQTSKKSKGEVK